MPESRPLALRGKPPTAISYGADDLPPVDGSLDFEAMRDWYAIAADHFDKAWHILSALMHAAAAHNVDTSDMPELQVEYICDLDLKRKACRKRYRQLDRYCVERLTIALPEVGEEPA